MEKSTKRTGGNRSSMIKKFKNGIVLRGADLVGRSPAHYEHVCGKL